jgi:uncharacterized protein (TIGR03435 family)
MRAALMLASVILAIGRLMAQDAPEPVRFEVVSVKRTERCDLSNSIDPGLVTLKGVPISLVLQQAFQVRSDEIEGPSWIDADCFEIFGKIPEGIAKDRLPAMLKTLLAERFKLVIHTEIRLRSGYVLSLDKRTSKLKETTSDSTFLGAHTGGFMFGSGPNYGAIKGSMTIKTLATRLSRQLKVPVEDLTGLTENYDIDISWLTDPSSPPPAPSDSDALSTSRLPITASMPSTDLIGAIRDSLGLRLELRKMEVHVIVIDHIERFPGEN